ncbi:hypothetical protein [Agrococcus sediminis]|uniref:hypothetical protein n=1 Tax=Agrococcus sediminis TaxID=2599924 RepID=UPI0034275A5E
MAGRHRRHRVTARVGLTTGSPGEQPTSALSDGHRLVLFGTRAPFATVDDAETWLERDETALLLEIVGTLELSSIPAPALPEG